MSHRMDGDGLVLQATGLARVEGEGGMRVVVRNGQVDDVQLDIYEPPRFFEALLRGRAATEAPDITSRICGICPIAYQMSACAAVEDACRIVVPEHVRLLRRLLYCGEWIESHALHVYLLHAPDFLGYPGAVEMARDHPELVRHGLALKKAGNEIMSVVGGRAVHPVNVRVGGFHRLPIPAELAALRRTVDEALGLALETVRAVAAFDAPDLEQPYAYMSLRVPEREDYPIEAGSFVTSDGDAFGVPSFLDHVAEQHVAHSNALHARLDGGLYVVGPLARYSLNSDRLPPLAREAATAAGLGDVCRNPFRSIVVRAVELVAACEEAVRILDTWAPEGPAAVAVPLPTAPATGHGATEAPRGVLYHRYTVAADGSITDAVIVPPTSQNLASIEADLRRFVQPRIGLDAAELTRQCEQAIRNYDPCISCATHFLRLTVEDAT